MDLKEAALAIVEARKDPRCGEKEIFQLKVVLVKEKLKAKLKLDCYSKEDLDIAKSLPNYVEPTGRFGEPKKIKKPKKKLEKVDVK